MACNAVFESVNTTACRPDMAPTARAVWIPTSYACRMEAPSEILKEIVSSPNDTPAVALPSRTEPPEKNTLSVALHLSMLRMPCSLSDSTDMFAFGSTSLSIRIVMPGSHDFWTAL